MTSAKRKRSPSPSSRKRLHTETDEDPTAQKSPDKNEEPTDPTSAETDPLADAYAELMRSIGGENTNTVSPTPIVTLPINTAPAPPQVVPVQAARRKNPWAGKPLKISKKWGTRAHEKMHFGPTVNKPNHGVWRTQKVADVQEWVRQACDSIRADTDDVVASKPGEKGGYNFLVDMGRPVGYISGSNIQPNTRPEASHLAVYVNKKGYPVTAFPCTPEIFLKNVK